MHAKRTSKTKAHAWIEERAHQMGLKAADLARRLGHKRSSSIYDTIKGARRIQPRERDLLSQALLMTTDQMHQAERGRPLDALDPPLIDQKTGRNGMKLMRRLRMEVEGSGAYVVRGNEADPIERPPNLRFAPRSFALIVPDEASKPVYQPADTLLINPDAPVREHDEAVFCSLDDPFIRGEARVLLARVIKKNHNHWMAQVHGERDVRRLEKKHWPACWKVRMRDIH